MKSRTHFYLTALLTFLFAVSAAACATLPATEVPTRTEPAPPEQIGASPTPEIANPIAQLAIQQLAATLGIPATDITVESVEEADWPNGCLGIDYLGMPCTDAIVPGYLITLQANGQTYEYHSNLDGSLLFSAVLLPSISQNPIAEAARQVLAEQLDTPIEQITVSSIQEVDWPDGCLGIQTGGVACITVIVPGYQIILQANGVFYEYRSNEDGSVLVFAGPVNAPTGPPVLTYSVEGGISGFCSSVEIYATGQVNLTSCNTIPQQATIELDKAQLEQVLAWASQYQDLNFSQTDDAVADQMTTTLVFDGNGSETVPDNVRQQMQDLAAQLFSSVRGISPIESEPLIGGATPIAPAPGALAGLIYAASDGLWQVSADGTPAQLFDQQAAILSPDGSQFISSDGNDLWLTDRATDETRNLTNTPERVEYLPPQTGILADKILFTSFPVTAEVGPGFTGYLTVVNPDGTGYRVLDEENNAGTFAVSSDGQTVAYGGGPKVWFYHLDTETREAFNPANYGLPEVAHLGSPSWSPDRTRLAWLVSGIFGGTEQFAFGVFDLKTRTHALYHLHQMPGMDGFPPAAVWSPDGSLIAITTFDIESGRAGVWVVPVVPPNNERPEVYVGGGNPVWSPDGSYLVVVNYEAGGLLLVDTGSWQQSTLELPNKSFFLLDWR